MEILFDRIDEPIPAIFSCIGFALAFHFSTNRVDYDFLFITGVKFGDFSGTQQIVDIDKESFVGNLSFRE